MKHFQEIFIETVYSCHNKLNDTAMSEKYHFIFQNVKNMWSTVSFCPVAKHET